MLRLRRNQIVIGALIVMVGVAGWLSYLDRKNANGVDGEYALTENGEISALVVVDSATGTELPVVNAGFTDDDINIALTYGEVGYVLGDGAAALDDDMPYNVGEAIFVSATDASNFFAQEKLDREQGRARQRELLMEMINSQNIDTETKGACADKLLDIQSRIENETAAEAMLQAKGFGQAYVRIDDETVDVVVGKSALTEAEVAQIEDIVKRKTGKGLESIRISSVKK